LSILFRKAILKEDYEISNKFEEYIVLNKCGKELKEKLRYEKFKMLDDNTIHFSIFLMFYNEELLIDVEKTNTEQIKKILNDQIISGDVLFPWIYGRLLYDKYFDEFEGEDESLCNSEVLRLLKNTPKGVFQINNIVIGPFGILNNDYSRFIPPTKNVRLWHCSDPSCSSFHSVHLDNENTVLTDVNIEIEKFFSITKQSEWSRYYFSLIETENYFYDYDRATEIHSLIINAFGTNELKELLKDLIDNNKLLRSKFPEINKLKGSSSDIVKNIEKDECFQLILLEDDKKIIASLERLIERNTIDIPATEIRTSIFNLNGGFYEVTHQCNRLGIRSVLNNSNQSLVRLIKLIELIHKDETLQKDLEWKLMDFKKESFRETIEAYVLSEEPRNIIKESVLYGPRQTENAINLFNGNFKTPSNEAEKEYLIDKMLWKLGFDINIYPTTLQYFWKKLKSFKTVGTEKTALSESDKDEIRSAAVNFFVLLEEILEQSLSYITWTLLSDHYIDTKFEYNFEDARNVMCNKLNGHQVGSNEPLKLDNTGNNNLFGLIEGFTALIEVCDSLYLEGKNKYLRQESEMPHFHNKAELTTFPFPSKLLLFDIKPSNYSELKSILSALPKNFNKFKVASVRNRLEHKNRVKDRVDNFPTSKEILEACECIESTIKQIETAGIYPNVFLFKESSNDKFNRVSYSLEDWKGNTIKLKPLPQFSGSKLPGYKKPQVISSIINIGESCELLRFRYQESSEYLKFWKMFPRKKEKLSSTAIHTTETVENIVTEGQ